MQVSRDRFIIIALFVALAISASATAYVLWQSAQTESVRIELGDDAIEVSRDGGF